MIETHRIGATISFLFVCIALLLSSALTRVHEISASDAELIGVEPGVSIAEADTPIRTTAAAVLAVAATAPRVVATSAIASSDLVFPIPKPEATPVVAVADDVVPQAVSASPVAVAPVQPSKPNVSVLPAPGASFSEQLVMAIHARTNAIRADEKLPLFTYDAELAGNAAGYSAVMQSDGLLGHTDSNGCNMTCRFNADGYKALAWGENLAHWKSSYAPTVDELAEYFVAKWVESEGHRDNLLSPTFTHEGIGVSREGNEIYVTVHFADPS